MDSHSRSQSQSVTKTRLSRAFAKVLHIQKLKSTEKVKPSIPISPIPPLNHPIQQIQSIQHIQHIQQIQQNESMDVFVAKVFAAISSVKAAYAKLQFAQTPYDPDGIQLADRNIVDELKRLSEFKQLFLKKHLDDDINPPETTQLLAEIQEQKNLVQMYDITVRKLDSEKRLKDSEIIFLKEKLKETHEENKLIETRLSSRGCLSGKINISFNISRDEKLSFSSDEKLSFSCVTVKNFLFSLQQATKSVKGFVKVLMGEMKAAGWDLPAAAGSIQPHVARWETSNIRFAFESFFCRVMFDGFNNPGFSDTTDGSGFGFDPDPDSDSGSAGFFIESLTEMRSVKAREYITWKPNSMFAKFCGLKYLKLVHPVMEFSLFGNLNQRNLVSAGQFPETPFFTTFADVAKRVWTLHCLAFAFHPSKASVFQVRKGSRFTELFMESVNEDPPSNANPEVGFTVFPGFKVGSTVIQCQVYVT